MAVLSNADRSACWGEAMRDALGTLPLSKADLRAAVNAIDDWCDTNAAAFNTAIPQPARAALSARQKAALLMIVVSHRFAVSS